MTGGEPKPDPSRCPTCGQPNECQLCTDAAWKGLCWCAKLEIPEALLAQVPPEARHKTCICRNCVMTYQSQKYKTAVVPANQPGDFYFDSNGLLVFSAAYLRRRGHWLRKRLPSLPISNDGDKR